MHLLDEVCPYGAGSKEPVEPLVLRNSSSGIEMLPNNSFFGKANLINHSQPTCDDVPSSDSSVGGVSINVVESRQSDNSCPNVSRKSGHKNGRD